MKTEFDQGALQALEKFRLKENLSRRKLAEELGINYGTFKRWFFRGKSRKIPSAGNIQRIKQFLELRGRGLAILPFREAQERAQKIKYLLLVLEQEIRWFRDNSREARDVFREELDLGDVGYLSSLLSMLGDEDKFKRWLKLTTNKFNFFRTKGARNEKNSY